MEQLDGLRALVTGGGSGIGAAIAARLKQGGARVIVVDIDPLTSPGRRGRCCRDLRGR